MRVLLVEDEQPLAKYVAAGLRKHGFAVDVAFDGRAALDKCVVTPYDVVVLDRDLPVVHGDTVCRELAEQGTTRILMLTASGTVEDRVEGLTLGADDYLGKPFAFTDLVARVRALGRQQVTRDGRPVMLGRREFAVLEELMRADGADVSAEQLLEANTTVSSAASS
jgi:DNA-binding response OmpR family regulator